MARQCRQISQYRSVEGQRCDCVPAIEDLDPDYIDPPRTEAPPSLGTARRSAGRSRGGNDGDADGLARSSSAYDSGDEPISTARTNSRLRHRRSGAQVESDRPRSRSTRTAPSRRRDNDPDHTGRPTHRPLAADDEAAATNFQTRTAARPRATTADIQQTPESTRVRQGETLRSIARDMLGDSHRAGEILDLNRDLIDDPSHLVVGQMIELPDDSRTSVRRSASR